MHIGIYYVGIKTQWVNQITYKTKYLKKAKKLKISHNYYLRRSFN